MSVKGGAARLVSLVLVAAAWCPARAASAQELEPLPPPAPALPAPLPPAPPMPPPPPPASEVRFEPEETDVALYRLSTAAGVDRFAPPGYASWYALYDPVCHGPCATRLAPGAYRLALAKGGHIVPVPGPVIVAGPTTLRAEYVDRSGLRAAGLIIGVAGAVGGFVMVVASANTGAVCDFNGFCVSTGTTDVPLLAAGVSVLVGSAVVGSILTFQGDSARITVEPLNLSGHAPREATLTAWRAPHGAAVALHF